MEEKLSDSLLSSTGIKKKLIDWAMGVGIQGTMDELHNRPTPTFWGVAKKLFNKIKTQIGLDQCSLFYTGAAPIKETTRRFYMSMNSPITNVYGMSETTAPFTVTKFTAWKQF